MYILCLGLQCTNPEEPVSLVTTEPKEEEERRVIDQKSGVVTWSPPAPNWNPWSACNIDEGPMAFVSLGL